MCHSCCVDCVKAGKHGRRRIQRHLCKLYGSAYSEPQDKPSAVFTGRGRVSCWVANQRQGQDGGFSSRYRWLVGDSNLWQLQLRASCQCGRSLRCTDRRSCESTAHDADHRSTWRCPDVRILTPCSPYRLVVTLSPHNDPTTRGFAKQSESVVAEHFT